MQLKPSAWLIPVLITFKDAEYTSCPPEHQAAIEGTVAWTASIFTDTQDEPVIDKYGVAHYPKPLDVVDELKFKIPRNKQDVIDYLKVASAHVDFINSVLQEVLDSKPGSES